MITIGDLPAAWRRAWTARIVGFQRSAVTAGKYSALRSRPGPIFDSRLRPRSVPDSISRGTSPAKAAACRADRYGLSKSSASRTAAVASPMPGMLVSKSRCARKPGC